MRYRFLIALLATALLILVPSMRADAAGAAPITLSFDHLSTGFELDGVHRDLPCESCHLNAVFKGTPRNCGLCHITGSVYNATPKTQTHVQSSNNCVACHNTISFRPDVHFDHREVMGSCVSCHNGTIAQGKDPKIHPQTSDACDACHTVMSWNPPKAVDHTQIPLAVQGFCIICHNGTSATGKIKGHILTSLECGDCHLTTTWLGANFDHTGIKTGCFSCHNGTKAVGKQGNHMPTSNTCEACHTTGIGTATPSWAPSAFDHTQMSVQTCATCHSGTVKITTGFVSGMPTNHVPPIPSAVDCGVCHGNTPAAETWTVLAASIATLHSGLNVSNCLMCHAGQTFAGVPAPYIPMSISGVSPTKNTPLAPPHIPILAGIDCSACHGAAYTVGGFGPATAMSAAKHAFVSTTCDVCHDTGKSFYVGSGTPLQLRPANHINSTDPGMATGDCSMCHNTADWTSKNMPVGHMPNPSSLTCATCHVTPNDYTPATLAANSVLHTGITGMCGQCHGDNVTALTWANNFTPKDAILTPNHIPYLSGTDCSSCHTSTTYAVGGFGPMNMTAAKHAFVPTSCNSCHEAGLSFTMGAASPALQGRPPDHTTPDQAAPNDCSNCHTPANWISSAIPAGHMPNPGNQGCAVCHTAIGTTAASYATLASIAVLHTSISGNCGLCHGSTSQLTFYNSTNPNASPKDAVLTPSHIPYLSGTDCSSCHAANYVTGGFGPTNMSAAKHAFVPTSCDSCHEAGLNFYLGASTPALQGRPASHISSGIPQEVSGDCSGCHNTTDWTTTAKPANHMPTPGTQTCSVCHIAIGTTQASYDTLASIPVLHTGITGSCGLCHGDTTKQLTFFNAAIPSATPKAAFGLTPSHIPYLVGTDCSSCHASNYVAGGFGPTNMSPAKHAFVPTTCNTCHDTGKSFYLGASTPALQTRPDSTTPYDHITNPPLAQMKTGDCSSCHNTTTWTTPKNLPGGHMPIPGTQTCSVCHIGGTNFALLASTPILHTGIASGCGQCHGGGTQLDFYHVAIPANFIKAAASLVPGHIPSFPPSSSNDCSACHTGNYAPGGFGPMNMNQATHASVSNLTCVTCHEAGKSFYMGGANPKLQTRPADHNSGTMLTGDCSACHTTANWLSTTLPAGHMPNPANTACNTCHTAAPANYTALAANSVLHTGIASSCGQCHGGTTALTWYNNFTPKDAVLAPAHIPYIAGTDCGSCHKSTTYAAGTFGPMNMTQATHAFVSTTSCNTCHGTATVSFYMGAASPTLQLRPADHTAGAMLTGDCSGCHTTANWNSNTLPTGHMPNPANQGCTVCHTAAPTNYTTLAANLVLHTGITASCSQCHGLTQLTFFNSTNPTASPKSAVLSPPHIPFLSGADCGSCHKSTTYAAGSFGPMNMTQATHAFVSTTCNTCHGTATVSFYIGAASPGLQLRPANHNSGTMLTGDCSGCHTTANWNSGSLPAGHMPNPGNQGCSVCHVAAPANYTTLASNTVLHTGISSSCITCHGAPNATKPVFYLNYTPKAASGLAPPHIPSASTPCESCHTGAPFATFSGTTMTAAKHTQLLANTGGTCDQCHDLASLAFYGVNNLQHRPSPNHYAGRDCNGCHGTNNWNGAQKRKAAAAPATTKTTVGIVANTGLVGRSANTGLLSQSGVQLRGGRVLGGGIAGSAALANGATSMPGVTRVSHAGVVANCASCHNGVLATGKGPLHIASNNTCENCHTTLAWMPAHFDHRGVTATCVSCHNGVTAPGKPTRHIQTNQDCSACHGTIAWAPANFNHLGINATCQSCHNGVAATAKQIGHIPTTLDCGSCHSTLNWTTTTTSPQQKPLISRPKPSPRAPGAVNGPAK
jgi:hypothetical protein